MLKEITIEITSYCPYDCDYCSTNAAPDGEHISLESIEQFLNKSNITADDRINISGGEPLAHPKFWDILQLCKNKTKDVWVYTNALENIRYNASVISEINCEANVCLTPGRPIYIPEKASKVHLLQLVPQGRGSTMIPANIHISSNIGNKEKCESCTHTVLQADGEIAKSPCKKHYS